MALKGARGVTELSTLLGYYSLLAFNANAFEIDVPEGERKPGSRSEQSPA